MNETVSLSGQDILYLQNVNGDIYVGRSESASSIRVEAELVAASNSLKDAEEWLDKLDVRISKRSDKVAIETDFPSDTRGRRLAVHYNILVPGGVAVDVLHVNGRIIVNDASGHIDIEHVNGTVEVNDLHGTIDAHLINGTIDCQVHLPHDGFVFLTTLNGEIRVEIPQSTSARLHGATTNGQVNFRNLSVSNMTGNNRDMSGTLGSGEGQIELSAVNGDIEVKGI